MTKAKIFEYFGKILLLALGLAAFWLWSTWQVEKRVRAECSLQHSQQELMLKENQEREIRNVEVKKSTIYSKPNANRDSLLNKMRAGQL